MKLRLLFPALFLGLGFSSLFAQTITPLAGYEQLRPDRSKAAPPAKAACGNFDFTDTTRVLAGEQLILPVVLDTFDLGPSVSYSCAGCSEANFGTATLRNDTIFYGADAGAEQGLDAFVITPCNAAGDCNDPVTVTVLVQRAGRTFQVGNRMIDPSTSLDVVIPADELPGGATCRSIAVCPDTDYPGREREFFFLNAQSNNNDFRYRSARYAGTDAVCVTLCNDLGLCDVYRTTFTVTRPTLSLPFFDDFSYEGVRPAAALWQDEDVLINRNFAVDPPSIGVATFDAVDFDGQPYAEGSGRSTVIRDFLTSAPIDLAGENNVNLNFYLQPRGLGNRPERQDSFLVQFLDVSGEWQTVFRQEGRSNTEGLCNPIPFTGYTIDVEGSDYLYNGFQFRFAAKSSEQGAVDMWHLDYVKLDDGNAVLVTTDVSLVEPPGFLLENYTSMPIRHLRAGGDGLISRDLTFKVRNHSEGSLPISRGPVNIFPPGQFVPAIYTVDIGSFLANNNDVLADTSRQDVLNLRMDTETFENLRSYLFNETAEDASTFLRVEYDYDSDTQDNDYAGGVLQQNDEASRITHFAEYMSYDDGSAEATLEAATGSTILQQYEAFAEDELTGISIRIPRGLRSLGNQNIRLVVYSGDTIPTDLVYSEDFPIRYAEDFFSDTLQGFTTYLFDEIITLPKGEKFFVGWEQLSAGTPVGIGLDRNQSPADVHWFNSGSNWQRLNGCTLGAVMIRPLLAGFSGFTTRTEEENLVADLVEVFPNPTNGTLHLRPRPGNALRTLHYRLFSANGALLRQNQAQPSLQLGDLPAGLYLLEISDGTRRSHHKIVRH